MSKFDFVNDIKYTWDYITGYVHLMIKTEPIITMDLGNANSKYNYGENLVFFNLQWYMPYKPYVDTLIVGFTYLWYFFIIYRKLPDIISGLGATVNSSDKLGGK